MADNNLTRSNAGKQVDSRIQANSTSPRQTYAEQQLAIQDANLAQTQAEQRQAEAQGRADRARPAQNLMTGTVKEAIDEFMGRSPAKPGSPTPTPGRNARRGK